MVYLDTDVCEWHWKQLNITDDSIAIFHVPFPFDSSIETRVHEALIKYNKIIILCSELHPTTVDFIRRNQHPKIGYFICGNISNVNAHHWMDWFNIPLDFYRSHLDILDRLDPHSPKKLFFDVLLGGARKHRDFVYDFINKNHLADKTSMSYYRYAHLPLVNNQNFIIEPDVVIDHSVTHSIGTARYFDSSVHLSTIVPISIYNQTAYTVVTETNAETDFVFYTEKITKPILSKRLFIVIAGCQYLRYLKSLGFKTFETVIDESYDDIKDNTTRYQMACEQIKILTTLPQQMVLDKIKPIVEHNYKTLINTDWTNITHSNIKKFISS